MPDIGKDTVMVTSYVDTTYRRRMLNVQKRKPRLTISKQVARCIELGIQAIETEAGIRKSTLAP